MIKVEKRSKNSNVFKDEAERLGEELKHLDVDDELRWKTEAEIEKNIKFSNDLYGQEQQPKEKWWKFAGRKVFELVTSPQVWASAIPGAIGIAWGCHVINESNKGKIVEQHKIDLATRNAPKAK